MQSVQLSQKTKHKPMVEPFINIDELETILKNIESTLYLPSKFDLTETGSNVPYKISYAIVKTPLQLICGCTISNDIRLQYFEIDVVFDHLQQKSILNNKTAVDVDDFDSKHIHKIQMNFENNRDVCPLCYRTTDIKNAKIIKPLGQLYNQLEFLKTKYLGIENETFESNRKQDYDQLLQQAIKQRKRVIEKKYNTIHKIGDTGSEKNTANETKPKTLLQLFESVSLSIKEEKPDQVDKTQADTQIMNNGSNITESLHSEGNSAKTNRKIIDKSEANPENAFALSVPILDTHSKGDSGDKSSSHISETLQKASNAFMTYSSALGGRKDDSSLMNVTEDDENKEINYVKCFPKYRKRTHNAVYSKLFSPKSKLFINTDISRDCTKFVLLSEHKWEVYDIIERPNTSQKGSEQPFAMKCCGRVNGDYGPSFNSLVKNNDLTKIIPDETYAFAKDNTPSMKNIHINNDGGKVRVWDHLFCKIMNNFLVIAGTKGILRIIDLDQGGKIIKTLKYRFPIRCIDVDSSRNVVACGITGKDRTNGAEQALVVFQKVSMDKDELPPPITITLPYRDPINTLQFSDDGLYLSCTTCFENRFLVISVKKIEEPRLIMKSIRNIDNSLESEGITSTNMFPGNAGLMCVTSVAYNSPPIIIETKIKSNKKMYDGRMSFSNNDTKVSGSKNQVLQPSMLLRLDELGSKIYKAEISPRNDSIVFLDKSGTIFLLASSSNNFVENNEKRRILVLDNVSNAYKLKESASIRFSKNGHKLYIVDRKGIFYIEDFAAGLPTDNFVTQCKQVN